MKLYSKKTAIFLKTISIQKPAVFFTLKEYHV